MKRKNISEKKLKEIVYEIVNKLNKNKPSLNGIGIKHGKSGASLLYHSYYLYSSDKFYLKLSKSYLYGALESLNNGYSSPSLYREIAEFGWCLAYLSEFNDFEDPSELLKDIDQILLSVMQDEIRNKNFDPITGVLSYGYYFLKRAEKSAFAREKIVQDIVPFLLSISMVDDNGRYWVSKLKEEQTVYFGITHGITNVILFLIYCEQAGILRNKCEISPFIEEACKYILNHQYETSHYQIVPIIKGENKQKEMYSKNYCYGDYSTLFGLYHAFDWLDDIEGRENAALLLQKCFQKGHQKPYLQGGASLIYGHSGLSMIFRNLHLTSHIQVFKEAQHYFISEITKAFDPDDEFLGFHGYWNQDLEHTNYCLAEGMIGIALELIAFLTDGENKAHDPFFFIENPYIS